MLFRSTRTNTDIKDIYNDDGQTQTLGLQKEDEGKERRRANQMRALTSSSAYQGRHRSAKAASFLSLLHSSPDSNTNRMLPYQNTSTRTHTQTSPDLSVYTAAVCLHNHRECVSVCVSVCLGTTCQSVCVSICAVTSERAKTDLTLQFHRPRGTIYLPDQTPRGGLGLVWFWFCWVEIRTSR